MAIVGSSGSGKSTLLHLLGGLDTPSEGNVIFRGQHINQLTSDERAAIRNKDPVLFINFITFYRILPPLKMWQCLY